MKKFLASLALAATVIGLGVAGSVVAHPGHDHTVTPSETAAATGTYLQPAMMSTDSRLQPGSTNLQSAVGISAQGGTELNQLTGATLR